MATQFQPSTITISLPNHVGLIFSNKIFPLSASRWVLSSWSLSIGAFGEIRTVHRGCSSFQTSERMKGGEVSGAYFKNGALLHQMNHEWPQVREINRVFHLVDGELRYVVEMGTNIGEKGRRALFVD